MPVLLPGRRARLHALSILLFFLLSPALGVWALDVPPLTGRVVDLAQVLPTSVKTSLESQLAAHESQTSNQVAVLTLPTLKGEPLEAFSHRVASAWELGQKGTDNGALVLVAIKERKVRIEVGYGLEGTLTDLKSSRIIRNDMVPHFRKGDYAGGVSAGVVAILQTIEGTYQGESSNHQSKSPELFSGLEQFFIAIAVGTFVGLMFSGRKLWVGVVVGNILALLIAMPLGLKIAFFTALLTGILIHLFSRVGTGGSSGDGMLDYGPGWGHRTPFGTGSFGGLGGGGGFSGGGGGFGGGGASGGW